MLRHTGQKRTYRHNLRLAALLCLTAGFVNISGLLGFYVLTTNVTGHAAYMAEKFSQHDLPSALAIGLWLLLFLLGAFTSAWYIRSVGSNARYAFTVPIVAEMIILLLVGTLGASFHKTPMETECFAGSLLFAMGMQNALVTMISGSVVRTTHLTGMFTDLGIDLSAVLKEGHKHFALRRRVLLRIVIIFCFLLGGVLGGYIFPVLRYHTFYIPAGILCIAMFYDSLRFRALKMIHSIRSGQ
ncbi:MAG: hypothetical protein BGO69_08810 [Bacteroidetes bacterium 46-16]|nr:MAG: hypothetical protein BGO69_08810 [Bacteroidetes bacterium 46-16]